MGRRPRPGRLPHDLVILHEDRDILVVDKPAGLLTVGTERDKSHTAYFVLTNYVRKGCARSQNRVFIVHRLDRETSGVLVFAKSEEAKSRLQGEWSETKKSYLAIVHGLCQKSEETITTYLAENKAHVMYSTSDRSCRACSCFAISRRPRRPTGWNGPLPRLWPRGRMSPTT